MEIPFFRMAAQPYDATEMIVVAEAPAQIRSNILIQITRPHVLNINVNSRIKACFSGLDFVGSVVVEVEPLNGFLFYIY